MDSALNSKLSFIDEINYMCPTHSSIYIGVCGNIFCKEKDLICMKCIKSNETCITKNSHELVSLTELFYQYFLKQQNKELDFNYINSATDQLKEIDRSSIFQGLQDLKKNTLHIVENQKILMSEDAEKQINTIIDKNKEMMEKLNSFAEEIKSDNTRNFIKEIQDFLKLEISQKIIKGDLDPEIIPKKIQDYIKNKNSKDNINDKTSENNDNQGENNSSVIISEKEKSEILEFMKISNSNKSLQEKSNTLVKLTKLEEMLDEFDHSKLEKKIDSSLENLEKIFDEILLKMEESVEFKRDEFTFRQPSSFVKFKSDPKNFEMIKCITQNSHCSNSIDSTFCAFKSINGETIVAWGSPSKYLEFYDLNKNKLLKTITAAHSNTIFSCRHYLDTNKKEDLIVTSSLDQSVKIWSFTNNFQNILHIKSAANVNYIYSSAILCEKFEKKNYVISACSQEQMKIWDFNGKLLRQVGSSAQSTYFVDVVYHAKQEKYFILNANSEDVKAYYFKTGVLFHQYKSTPQTWHMSAILNQMQDTTQLLESDGHGNISIWNFDNAVLLKKIKYSLSSINLRGICLWNDKYLFSAASDSSIKLFDLEKGVYVKDFKYHTKTLCSVQKIYDENEGECFISHSLDGKLAVWGLKKK